MFLKRFFLIFFVTLASNASIIEEALEEEKKFRLATMNQIHEWLQIITSWPSSLSKEKIKIQTLAQLCDDANTASNLHLTEGTYSATSQKLGIILPAAIQLFEIHAEELMAGKLPLDLRNYWSLPRQNNEQNLRELALKAALYVLARQLNTGVLNSEVLDRSPTLHSTPLPSNMKIDLSRWSFFFNDTHSPVEGELAFVHGGYAFGGQRQDTRYKHFGPYGKLMGPQDCSSWISKLIGLTQPVTTVELMAYSHADVKRHLKPVNVSVIHDVKPGTIWVTRSANNQSGHVVLVIETDNINNQVLVLEYARNLPHYEGFGFRHIPFRGSLTWQSQYYLPYL